MPYHGFFWPIFVHNSFHTIYVEKKKELGEPVSAATTSIAAVEIWMQHAYVIWMVNPGIMCGFDTESSKRFFCTKDAFHAISTEPELWKEDYVKARLKLNKAEYWPRGGMAYALIHDSKNWEWIGKVLKQCALEDGAGVYYQEFERGKIYGIFRATASNNDLSAGIAFVVLNDGTWSRETVSAEPPKIAKCEGD